MTRVIVTAVQSAMKKMLLTAALVAGSSAMAVPVNAQGWSTWDGPRSARQRPPVVVSPADDSDDSFDDRYDNPRDRSGQYEPNWQTDPQWRDDDPDDRDNDPRYQRRNAQPQYENPDAEDYDEQAGGALPQGPRGPDGKPIGKSGGPQPVVQAVAPEIVSFSGPYTPGSIVIDTGARKLYYIRDVMSAFAYPIGVGREGFSWTGTEKVSRIADWPDWYPPAEMRKRKPELPERMLGGLNNPLGAKAIYLGNTLYRIHGTNDPKSIGHAESSGCFRMLNANVMHLASLVQVGADVTVVHSLKAGEKVATAKPAPQPQVQKPLQQRPRDARVQWSEDDDDWYEAPRYNRYRY